MRTHSYTVGDLVKARPLLHAPRSPQSSRHMAWPFFFPARIIDLIGDDGVLLEFVAYDKPAHLGQVITPWSSVRGYSARELHPIDCTCSDCEAHESLTDPRQTIDDLTAKIEGIGAIRAERTGTLLTDHGFPGSLLVLTASSLQRGDFLLFPQQHLHEVAETRGDIRLRTCNGSLVLGAATQHLSFRPVQPAPVCDSTSPFHDARFAATAPASLSALEAAALACLTDLGLADSTRKTEEVAVHR